MKDWLNFIFPAALGSIFTGVGFFVKYLSDYFWLKSPRITIVPTHIWSQIVNVGQGVLRLDYTITCKIFNNSENIAYMVKVEQIKVLPPFEERKEDFRAPNPTIDDKNPSQFTYTISSSVPHSLETRNATAETYFKDHSPHLIVKLSYINKLGKEYSKELHLASYDSAEMSSFYVR